MKILKSNLSFGPMSVRKKTTRIILHHAAASKCSPRDIHRWHKQNGWAGAGYHFLVSKDGNVYRLRPEKYVGAHAKGANSDSIGICFEGNFEKEQMNSTQQKSGIELINELKKKYGISKVIGHRDVNATDCPGKYFPLDKFSKTQSKKSSAKPIEKVNTAKDSTRKKWITDLQKECNRQGFSKQIVDGINGPNTLAGCPTLRYGARGNITKLLQQRLTSLSFTCGEIDGIFGTLTQSAVKQFQKAKKLTVDGVVGKNTWRALLTS